MISISSYSSPILPFLDDWSQTQLILHTIIHCFNFYPSNQICQINSLGDVFILGWKFYNCCISG